MFTFIFNRAKSLRTAAWKPCLYSFIWISLAAILILLFAGGFTTSIRAGMAFLDWPLSNGSLNPAGWLDDTDQFAEHSHRLLGMQIGILSLILMAWVWLREERPFVRKLAIAIVGLVILQGFLGGLRVLLDPLNGIESIWVSRGFAIAHAFGGQLILCLWVSQLVLQSHRGVHSPSLLERKCNLGYWVTATLIIQLLLGAIMRHSDAGLAIPTFPKLPDGSWIPHTWNFAVGIHWAHRAWAIVVSLALIALAVQFWREKENFFKILSISMLIILVLQIALGIHVILLLKNPYVTTFHMLIGAILLALVWGGFCAQKISSSKNG